MSNKKKVNRKRRRSPWFKMFAKTETRLSARVTREEDWQTDVPNIRLSRAFVIVLLMHLVVLAAVVAFTVMNPSDAKPKVAAVKPAPKQEQAPSAAKVEAKPVQTLTEDDRLDDMRRHIVHSGDSVSKIAGQYGVSSADIHAVNRIDELYQLYQGRVLRIPVSASQPIELNNRMAEAPATNTNGSNFVKTEQSRTLTSVPRANVIEPISMNAANTRPQAVQALLPTPAPEAAPAPVVAVAPRATRTIGNSGIVRPVGAPAQSNVASVASGKTYKVKKGDNAFRIGKRFGIHYKTLLKHNGISDAGSLQIGQVLRIPN